MITIGMVLYNILYVLPQFLSGVAGYNAFQSGWVLALSGLPAFALMPVLPRILRFGNVKLVVGFGLMCFACSCFIDIHLTAQSSGRDFIASQLLRGVGQIFSFMPLNQISVGAVSRSETADAAGLFNMARNLGGSIGLALLGVFIDRRTEVHADAIRESVNANSVLLQDRLAEQAAVFSAQSGDLALGQKSAIASLAGQIHQQAMVMTFSDCFWILGVGLLVMMPLLLLLRSPKPINQPVRTSFKAMSLLKNCLLTTGIALSLAACTVGPDYHGAPAVTATGTAFVRADGSSAATPPTAQWWTALGDAQLNQLIEETLATNPGVDVVRARVREARANLRLQTATGLPTTGATAAYLRTANISSLLGSGASNSGDSGSGSTGNSNSGGQLSSSGGGLNLYVVGFDATLGAGFLWRQQARRRRRLGYR